MQPAPSLTSSSSAAPPAAARRAAAPAAPAVPTASPFISLSTQCDLLYRIGPQPHHYAFISEQSVYTRAAEQLRFCTPSPFLNSRPSSTTAEPLHDVQQEEVAESMAVAEEAQDLSPRVCMATPLPSPFPTIRRFELAKEAEGRQAHSQAPTPRPLTPTTTTTTTTRTAGAASIFNQALTELVPSGAALATATFHSDFAISPFSSMDTGSAAAEAEGQRERRAENEPTDEVIPRHSPNDAASLSALIFPSSVVVRVVAQMVLAMQAATQNSAARCSLARYRGVALPAWVRATRRDASLSTALDRAALQEALVFSVLPQVIVDRITASTHSFADSAGLEADADSCAVFYAVASHLPDPLLSVINSSNSGKKNICGSSHSASVSAGKKREREDQLGEQVERTPLQAERPIVPGPVACTRLFTSACPTAPQVTLTYSAVTPETFQSFHQASDSATARAASTSMPSSMEDTVLYHEEAAWLTHGVLRRLFTFPATTTNLPHVACPYSNDKDASSNVVAADVAPAPSAGTEESLRSTYATFLKTNAFLFLSFLVHHSWCLHVHTAVTAALIARASTPTAPGKQAHFVAMHITCLPRLDEVRRFTQHEWQSELTYRLCLPKPARKGESGTQACAMAGPPLTSPAAGVPVGLARVKGWQLTVTVVNRSAELRWHHTGSFPMGGVELPAEATRTGVAGAGESSLAMEGSGVLDQLVTQVRTF